ncbi:YoaK family protein [Streptomyces iranensis]|uniref:Uncharacterized membrane protein YoaK (UPF0700 family) n=1 Tax=Streptomyces iranensis TaxID=576784 RepID=A0A060ZIF1_9ACTN|nr:YoaK family protein [Streptomyces iranensis]MBP2068558.1 uncharacterized membrane protein YoaK (UPF0700 family) [Streptomyces iranensis]CDR01304.1 predicted protein [Streptomyces iranensis]
MTDTQTSREPSAARRTAAHRLPEALLLVLTFATGIVDAVSFLSPERVFAGNMTGNVVIIGVVLSGAQSASLAAPGLALVCFALGAAVAGRALREAPPGWSSPCTAMVTGVGAILVAVAGALLIAGGSPGHLWGLAVAGALSLALGAQAATARQLAVKDVPTVVVTSTMTGLAADSWLGAHRPQPALRRAAAILLLAAGAGLGAGLVHWQPGWAVAAAAAPTLAVAVVGQVVTTRMSGR